MPPIRWILDAYLLIEKYPINWEILISEVKRCGWKSPIYEQLSYLSQVFGASVPENVLESLRLEDKNIAGALMNYYHQRSRQGERRLLLLLYAEILSRRNVTKRKFWMLYYLFYLPISTGQLLFEACRLKIGIHLNRFD